MALLHLLLDLRKTFAFSLDLAHIDHGWRIESQKEATVLREMAKGLGLPFHFKRLEKMEGSDLENRARSSRYDFFSQLQEMYGFQALLLGHHRKDQAETVFKRVAEGSGIQGLGGIYPERRRGNLLIWRPLLSLRKEALFAYLKKNHLEWFEDRTNQDCKYLRSRLRGELFPAIEAMFGKKIEGNLARLGALFQDLSFYFEEKSEVIKSHLVYGPFGAFLDLRLGFHTLELKIFLKKIAPISHPALEKLFELIENRRSSCCIQAPPYTFALSQFYLFMYQEPFPHFFRNPHAWTFEETGNWQTFWQGRMKVPKGECLMQNLSELKPKVRKRLKKWYLDSGVPSFFYEKAPVFVRDQEIIGEPLTGKGFPQVPFRLLS